LTYDPLGKRVLDVVLAGSALILLSPLLVLVVLAIKVSDKGPVIFVQTRIGKDSLPFEFFKFRSMPVQTGDIPSDQLGSIKLSTVGKIIRRTNIDELPQLFNILSGDMSVVGPRPPIPAQKELLGLRRESGALACRPGLTGLAQVNSYDGMSVAEKARYDEIYSRKITFWGDFSIILRTLVYLFKKPPVY
jgi:O-antigen biosynthesis protein WbqP